MRPWVKRSLVAAAVVPLLLGAGWLGVGFAVTAIANGALASRGMECDTFDVGFALDLSRATLGPIRCRFERGAIAELRLTGGGFVDLDEEQRPTHVEASGIELDLNQDPPRDVIAGLVEQGQVPPRVRDSMTTLTELATRDDVPTFRVRRVLLRRQTSFVTFRHVSLDREGEAVVIRVQSAAPPPVGTERLRIEGRMTGLEIRATRAEVRIAGRLEVDAVLPRRELHEEVPFVMTGAGLDGDAPTYGVEIELSDGLRELRERHERRVAEQAAAAAAPPAPPLRDTIRELRDSLRSTVASMQGEAPEEPVSTP